MTDTARQLLYICLLLPAWRTPREAAEALTDNPDHATYKRVARALNTLAGRGLLECRPTSRAGATLEYHRPREGAAMAAAALAWMREAARVAPDSDTPTELFSMALGNTPRT